MLSDTIIERNASILRNNFNIPACDTYDAWTTGSSGQYGFLTLTYEVPLVINHYYYYRYTYKFSTTNQSPTWVYLYHQGGATSTAKISNPVAGTVYTASGICQPSIVKQAPVTSGNMYNGPSDAINGVVASVKNVLCYDVTELFYLLKCNGVATTADELKTWCDQYLEWKPRNVNYDISELVESAIMNKVCISGGAMVANNFVETDGMQFYSVSNSIRTHAYFDTGSGVTVYNNKGNGTVTHTRVSAEEQDSPFKHNHKYVLKITTNGQASPNAGGFVAGHNSAADKIFIEKFVAKVPVGYTVGMAYNPQGTGSSVKFITPAAGTGNWEEYAILYKCGSSGSFSNGGHVYISGPDNTSVTWYVAYVNNCDITGNEYLKYYSVLPNKSRFNSATAYCDFFDTTNLISNGRCSKLETAMLPSGWQYDTTDYIGNANASIVQPVNAASGSYGGYVSINPTERYKLSMWVKCKADMTSFLTAVVFYTSNKTELNHTNVIYRSWTATTLTAALNPGDTQMTVSSNANWVEMTYSKVGFRGTGGTWSMPSYNSGGTSNGSSDGIVAGVSGSNIVLFKTAYTGIQRPVGTVVVESRDGATYPYPIEKGKLPTDNTWKYVEGYFGAVDTLWDGGNSYGSGWSAIPADARYLRLMLNIYTNTGSVPIKYSDIRIEQVSSGAGNRLENKIQLNLGDN